MFNETLAVLEQKLPRYFKGATLMSEKSFTEAYRKENEMNRNHKVPVTKHVMDMVRRNMTYEIDFYNFCKQRLQEQFNDL